MANEHCGRQVSPFLLCLEAQYLPTNVYLIIIACLSDYQRVTASTWTKESNTWWISSVHWFLTLEWYDDLHAPTPKPVMKCSKLWHE